MQLLQRHGGATMLYGPFHVVPEWRNGALAPHMAAHPDTSLGTEGFLALAPWSLTTDAKSSRSGDDLLPARRRVWICRGGSHGRRAACPASEGCTVTSPASAPARRRREPSGWLRLVVRGWRRQVIHAVLTGVSDQQRRGTVDVLGQHLDGPIRVAGESEILQLPVFS